ncbi:MAG: 2-aminoethylphosphonate--pyruvate transaminase [Anaerocolumna sp.]
MHYKLLTPGPLSTSDKVKQAMLVDLCTWDEDYKDLVEGIRKKLLEINHLDQGVYTTVLMQGSGTFGVESTIVSTISEEGKLLVLVNGVYGDRIKEIARKANKQVDVLSFADTEIVRTEVLEQYLEENKEVSHVAFVHCETTTGILNPLEAICQVVKKHNKILIVDAMSSLGGIPMNIDELGIDFIVSSANKCIQGVPGFSFIIAKQSQLKRCEGISHSLSLDLYDQWKEMEKDRGKWRFTSPTHVVKAFEQALNELIEEGGIEKRYERYVTNQKTLVERMKDIGFIPCIEEIYQSPIITTFLFHKSEKFTFEGFYQYIKKYGFVIYPGKLTNFKAFRIGNIGDINRYDMELLTNIIAQYVKEEL